MSNKRLGKKKAPKVPLSKRRPKQPPPRKFPIKGHTKARYGLRNGDSNEVNGTSYEPDYKDDREHGRQGDSGGLLTSNNPKEIRRDLRLVESAVRKGWSIKRKNMIVRRLTEIVDKTHVSVLTKQGPFDSEEAADRNAVAAARVLVAMNGQDQADDHLAIKNGQPESATNITINNVTNVDQRRVELARLADKFGARELVINGESVSPTEYLKSVDTVPEQQE